jgi:hypothetical protein
MENVRSRSSTVADARFLLIRLLPSLPPHILRRQQNAFDLDGFRCEDIVKVASEKNL